MRATSRRGDSMKRPILRDNLRAMPSAAWILLTGTLVNRLGTFVLPLITIYLTGRGLSSSQAGSQSVLTASADLWPRPSED